MKTGNCTTGAAEICCAPVATYEILHLSHIPAEMRLTYFRPSVLYMAKSTSETFPNNLVQSTKTTDST